MPVETRLQLVLAVLAHEIPSPRRRVVTVCRPSDQPVRRWQSGGERWHAEQGRQAAAWPRGGNAAQLPVLEVRNLVRHPGTRNAPTSAASPSSPHVTNLSKGSHGRTSGRCSRGPCREVRERLACVGSSQDRRDDARRWPRGVDFDGRATLRRPGLLLPSTRALGAARIPGRPQVLGRAAPGGSYETPGHRAGRRRLSAPLLCRWRFTCETARAASVGALGHGRLPGSYEELVAAR